MNQVKFKFKFNELGRSAYMNNIIWYNVLSCILQSFIVDRKFNLNGFGNYVCNFLRLNGWMNKNNI